jgi:hypothetical protein
MLSVTPVFANEFCEALKKANEIANAEYRYHKSTLDALREDSFGDGMINSVFEDSEGNKLKDHKNHKMLDTAREMMYWSILAKIFSRSISECSQFSLDESRIFSSKMVEELRRYSFIYYSELGTIYYRINCALNGALNGPLDCKTKKEMTVALFFSDFYENWVNKESFKHTTMYITQLPLDDMKILKEYFETISYTMHSTFDAWRHAVEVYGLFEPLKEATAPVNVDVRKVCGDGSNFIDKTFNQFLIQKTTFNRSDSSLLTKLVDSKIKSSSSVETKIANDFMHQFKTLSNVSSSQNLSSWGVSPVLKGKKPNCAKKTTGNKKSKKKRNKKNNNNNNNKATLSHENVAISVESSSVDLASNPVQTPIIEVKDLVSNSSNVCDVKQDMFEKSSNLEVDLEPVIQVDVTTIPEEVGSSIVRTNDDSDLLESELNYDSIIQEEKELSRVKKLEQKKSKGSDSQGPAEIKKQVLRLTGGAARAFELATKGSEGYKYTVTADDVRELFKQLGATQPEGRGGSKFRVEVPRFSYNEIGEITKDYEHSIVILLHFPHNNQDEFKTGSLRSFVGNRLIETGLLNITVDLSF